jgi:hypothetical protein
MQERIEVRYLKEHDAIQLLHFYTLAKTSENGDKVACDIISMNPEAALDLAKDITATYDKSIEK